MELKLLFEHATTFGSLIQIPKGLAAKLPALKQLSAASSPDLFVSDALKRLGPLVQQAEMLAAQYDAVVVNPPYMESKYQTPDLRKFLKVYYEPFKKDVFAAFIERGYALAKENGHNALVTMQSWMFLSSFEQTREGMLRRKTIKAMAHLGARAFGSISGDIVQTTTFVLQNAILQRFRPVFFRLLDGGEEEKRTALENGRERFDATAQSDFNKIPGSPIAYWVSDAVTALFSDCPVLSSLGDARRGLQPGNTPLNVRHWQEVSLTNTAFAVESEDVEAETQKVRWLGFAAGGPFRKWAGNLFYVVNWFQNGYDIKNGHNPIVANEHLYFREAISWSKISSGAPSFRRHPRGLIPGDLSPFVVTPTADYLAVFASLNSVVTAKLLQILSPTISFPTGAVGNVPVLKDDTATRNVGVLIGQAGNDWDAYERSWDFQSLPLLTASAEPIPTLESSYVAWIAQNRDTIAEMKRLEEENNRLFIGAYGLQDELTPDVPIEQITLTVNPAYRYGDKLSEEEQWARFRADTMEELVSYAIGYMMGRYSLEKPGLILANAGDSLVKYKQIIGEWQDIIANSAIDLDSVRLKPDTNASCFRCGPELSIENAKLVLLSYGGGLPLGRPLIYCQACAEEMQDRICKEIPLREFDYAKAISENWFHFSTGEIFLNLARCFHWNEASSELKKISFKPDEDGIVPLTDTEWFEDDACNRVVEFISKAWDDAYLEDNLTFLSDNLSPKKSESNRETIRRYLCDKFLKDHLQTYKKRPIYWLFSSGKQKAFQCLVYLHRYNEGTLARMRSEYVISLLGKMGARIEALQEDVQAASSTAHRKRLERELVKLQKQLVELQAFDDKLRHLADMRIALDLDDGVKVNYGKFGDLLAEVKAVHGKTPEVV